MFDVIYLTRDSTAQCVFSQGAGFNPPEFWSPCGLPVSCCIAMSIVRSSNSQRLVAVSMCASAWTRWVPRGLPSPRISMVLGGMKVAFVRPPPRDLGVRGASIVRCGLSCLVDFNSDLHRLCGSLPGLDTFWARGLSWINKETTITTGFYLTWLFTTPSILFSSSFVSFPFFFGSSAKNPFYLPHSWPSLETASFVPSLPSTTPQPSCYTSWLGLGWRRNCQCLYSWTVLEGSTGQGKVRLGRYLKFWAFVYST